MFRPGDRAGVAVSGGSDSVALLRLLIELAEPLGIHLVVLHFNHQLRGADSDADEQFVLRLAAAHGLECRTGRKDVAAMARTEKRNVEDAARRLRYAFLSELADALRLSRVAVAHTADDQAETVLARVLRGTGPAGLSAIYPVRDRIVRPLIELRRAELQDYLTGVGQEWREDLSNRDMRRLRARLRHQLMPALERDFQPAVVAQLCRLADLARADEAFWAAFVRQRVDAVLRREDGRLGLPVSCIASPLPGMALPDEARVAVASRMVRGVIEELRGNCTRIEAQHVREVLRLATEPASGHSLDLPGVVVERNFEWLWFRPTEVTGEQRLRAQSNQQEFSYAVRLGGPGTHIAVAVPEIRRRLVLKVIDCLELQRETKLRGALDRDLLNSPLVVRNWRPGDSFQPLDCRHVIKMKQLLREKRVPVCERKRWPVLACGDAVVWARELSTSADFAVSDRSRAGVLIQEEEM
jgi:tRNA(Ile)-lysidine synthase